MTAGERIKRLCEESKISQKRLAESTGCTDASMSRWLNGERKMSADVLVRIAKYFDVSAVGQQGRFHPTQKPVVLYKWILSNYAKDGDKILDTHVGSASSLIACEDMGFKYVGFEIDKEYYRLGKERLKNHKAQVSIMELMNDWRLP